MNQGVRITWKCTDSHFATDEMTATHVNVTHFTSRAEGLGHKIFMDNLFSSPRLFDDSVRCKINSCGMAQPSRRDMTRDFGPKQLKLERGDIRVRTRGGLTALVWEDRWEVYILTNMDPPSAEGNFCDDSNCPTKPYIVEQYNQHMGYIDNSDCMANSYSMSRCTFKWTTKLFFHLLDLTVLNSWLLLSLCGAKYRLLLARNLIEEAGKSQDRPTPRLVGRPSAAATNVCDSRVVIIKMGQGNLPHISSAVCVLHATKESEQSISVPNVMWACTWCLVSRNVTEK